MNTPNRLDKRSLEMQLENYKIIMEANSDLFEKDLLLKEHISHKMSMFESYTNELGYWGRKMDRIKYDQLLDQANKVLEEISLLIMQTLDQKNK